jgi:hypothetical protein
MHVAPHGSSNGGLNGRFEFLRTWKPAAALQLRRALSFFLTCVFAILEWSVLRPYVTGAAHGMLLYGPRIVTLLRCHF